ncbi:MAG: hypothetical protein IBJ14_04550 [Hydrogenophaga sp.]|nr:hypothetical protein [Hydrogenophaga sp.]
MTTTRFPLLPTARAGLLGLCLACAAVPAVRAQTAAVPMAPKAVLTSNDKPDLFIHPFYKSPEEAGLPVGFPNVAFCGGNDGQGGPARRVYFEVHNRGSVAAPASVVRVQFVNPQTQQTRDVDVPVQPLAAHTHVVKRLAIPADCFSPGSSAMCRFVITADPVQQVAERFENNNAQRSSCVGPTF